MWDLPQYILGYLAFNNFLQSLSKRGVQVSRIVLKILCKSSFIYLAIEDLKRLITGSIIRRSTKSLLWLDSRNNKDFKRLLEMHSLQGYL